VNSVLASKHLTIANIESQVLLENLDKVQPLEALTTAAENRLTATLREIDRRRTLIAPILRRAIQDVQDGEFHEIAPSLPRKKDAA
jgi:hypothetical protein